MALGLALSALVHGSHAAATDSHGGGEPGGEEGEQREFADGHEMTDPHTRTVQVPTASDGLKAQRRLHERSPGFATVVTIDHERDTVHGDGLGQVIARVPGVRVRSLGGLGQFTAVQLRGSSAQQVQLFLEGVPLNDSFGGLVDLSSQPLDGLERVEIHRGYVPIVFGGATLGGAIDLVSRGPRDDVTWGATAGYGSFVTREARAHVGVPLPRGWSMGASAGYAGSAGDFPYFDDGGTPRIREDDGTSRRQNNGYDRGFGHVRFDFRRRKVRLAQHVRASFRERGVAGTATANSTHASERGATVRAITRLDVDEVSARGGTASWVLGVTGGHRRFRDPRGQVGRSIDDQRMWSFDAYLSPRLRVPLWSGAQLGLVGDVRAEHVDVDERDVPPGADVWASGDATRTRWGFGVGAEIDQHLLDDALRIVPALRVDAFDSRFAVPEGEGESSDEGTDRLDVAVSPRLGLRAQLLDWLQMRASVGRYFRVPTLFELFGDRGFIIGNEGLDPERGIGIDGGFVVSLERPRWSLLAHTAGFATWSRNLIQFIQSGVVLRPINLPGALLRGVENGLSLRLFGRAIEIDGSYTLLDSRNRSPESTQQGQPLPGRPRHEGSGRIDVGYPFGTAWRRFEPRVAYSAEVVSATSLDLANRYRLPTRVFHGVGFELHWAEGVHLGVEVRNLADLRRSHVVPAAGPPDPVPVPVSDFIGYPVPGRSVFVRLAVDSRLFNHRERKNP